MQSEESWVLFCAINAGIEPTGNVVMKKAVFTVETISAGQGEVLVYVEDPAGHREEAKVTANNDKNRTYSVFYVPKVTGQHKVPISVYLKKIQLKTAQPKKITLFSIRAVHHHLEANSLAGF